MEKQVLNNKIGIQIMLIISGVALLLIGIFCCIISYGTISGFTRYSYSSESFYGYYYSTFYILIGIGIILTGTALIICGSIKIANYSIMKKSMKNTPAVIEQNPANPIASNNGFDYMRNKIAALQQMKVDGLISDDE
ncbi:MAG: hypothetical protein K2N18_06155, partial [Clostridia bacterium]|nr:hypothetical protein [Clostridia bacterium]